MAFKGCANLGIKMALIYFCIIHFCNKLAYIECRAIRRLTKSTVSKLISGLYFAGELIDVDAYTGGFNLQIAWSTGYAAGIAAGGRNFNESEAE